MQVRIEIILENATMTSLTGSQCFIRFNGTIVRSERQGMAVSFSGHEKVMTVRSAMDN